MKILLIEDDKEISKMLRSYLMTENFEVVCASDGQMAFFDIHTYNNRKVTPLQNQGRLLS